MKAVALDQLAGLLDRTGKRALTIFHNLRQDCVELDIMVHNACIVTSKLERNSLEGQRSRSEDLLASRRRASE